MKIKLKTKMLIALSLVAAVLLSLLGHSGHEGPMIAGVIALTEAEKAGCTEPELKVINAFEKLINEVNGKIKEGAVTKGEVEAMISGINSAMSKEEVAEIKGKLDKIEAAAKEQGTSLAMIQSKLTTNKPEFKSIPQVLEENKKKLANIYDSGTGVATFMITLNHDGQWVMKTFDATKAASAEATIDDVGGSENTAAISQSLDAATLLRVGGNAAITSQYRNTPWLFDLVSLTQAGFDSPLAMWYEEQVKDGASATAAEGATKPMTKYSYALKSAQYKKEATLVGFTDEFRLDFQRLYDDIIKKGTVDVINRINTQILANIKTAATAYNTAASFGGATVPNVNDFDVIAALAAQVDSATFGAVLSNAALMSSFKKNRMGITKSTTGEYVNRPSVLDNVAFIGNPSMAADDIIVGDLKQYNVILRGGFIVKIGYNGNDFANNMFSTVMEQYYMDYIAAIRKVAIVKGADFATVKTAIGLPAAGSGSGV